MSVKTVLIAVVVLAASVAGGAWYFAGQEPGPVLQLRGPGAAIGHQMTVEIAATAPLGRIKRLEALLEQNGQSIPLVSLASPEDATLTQETPERMRIVRAIPASALAGLKDGPARIVITATRPVFYGLRDAQTRMVYTVNVRLKKPTLSLVSTGHRIILGGAEVVLYRVNPPDAASGVQVGNLFYPGFPASGAGLKGDATLRIAFFALLQDQDAATPMRVVARDVAGNSTSMDFECKVTTKRILRSRVNVDDGFLARVVPAILKETPDLKLPSATSGERLNAFLVLNGELRIRNAATIEKIATATSPEMLWKTAFRRLGRTKTESAFADHRTYFYDGKEVDQQIHLGFDLASTRSAPVAAANSGRVLFAGFLGIYGNAVIIDHGMGLQSLYAHMSSIDVEAGDRVEPGETIGRSGKTGLAAGDHVHFSMLVAGRPVSSIEWWDQHWINDRILRKFAEAQGAAAPGSGVEARTPVKDPPQPRTRPRSRVKRPRAAK